MELNGSRRERELTEPPPPPSSTPLPPPQADDRLYLPVGGPLPFDPPPGYERTPGDTPPEGWGAPFNWSQGAWGHDGPGAQAEGRGAQVTARRGRPQGPDRPPGALKRAWERVVGAVAAVGALVLKFGALLIKLKYVGLILSMAASVAAYTLLWGWTFALGFVLLMLVHEMGHVVMLKYQGVPSSLPLFIPFLGAFVNMKEMPRSAYQEAQSGLAGPALGTLGSLVVELWGQQAGSTFLLRLAFVGFFLNIFNLLPALPLDGGRAAAALHPVIWLFGLVGLLVVEVLDPSPVIPLILVIGGYELWRRWRARNTSVSRAYYALQRNQRLVIGALYIAILAVALVGFHATYAARSL